MKAVTIVGARPQFIKCAPVSRQLRQNAQEVVVHTGQHYDVNMSDVFYRDLELPKPDYYLGIGSGSHGKQTGMMLEKIEEVLRAESPDCCVVYGDTNSTMAGALAASKLHIPVCHIEAGLRSFNRQMPEEINRVVTDHVSSLLSCPTKTAVQNLKNEGITHGVHLTGDVMYDALWDNLERARHTSNVVERLQFLPKQYYLATVHRAENTDHPDNLNNIVSALVELAQPEIPIVFPAHPRTQKCLKDLGWVQFGHMKIIDPVSYLDMLLLESQAKTILTDSGGVQKEAYWLSVPCVTLREETEWVETVESGWNVLVGSDKNQILKAVETGHSGRESKWCWGQGEASKIISDLLQRI